MTMNSPAIFNETKAGAWHFAAAVALLLAVVALWISPEFSLINLAASLTAGLLSFLTSLKFTRRVPRGVLSVWVLIVAALWLSPWAPLSIDSKRLVFSLGLVYFSLVFQGPVALFFAIFLVSFGLNLHDLTGPVANGLGSFVRADSFQALIAGLALATAIIFARIANSRAHAILSSIKQAVLATEQARDRVVLMQDGLQLTRERMLGRSITGGESLLGDVQVERDEAPEPFGVVFDELIKDLRQIFSEYQTKGRAEGRISGPIRFVFFAPVAGYDEKSIIALDLAELRSGVEACLTLALESLPEIGSRKREGVIRLSIRYGLRVIEVAIEDNGRGLASRNLQAETDLGSLKELVSRWGGKFDRLARLGVGSRTSLELRIVRERSRILGRRTVGAMSESTVGAMSVSTVGATGAVIPAEDVPHG